jgi:hypothetical protein
VLREERTDGQPETLDDSVDEFCYQLAVVLRRVLNLDEDSTQDDEGSDDWRHDTQRGFSG